MTKGVAIVSGGMDSVTMAYMLSKQGDKLIMVSFDYGQRHRKELEYARMNADDLMAPHIVVDLRDVGSLLKGSALTDNIAVPEGHYADETMKLTVVPNRNAIMLSIAAGIAVVEGAEYVATAVHAGDHPIYPDCRPEFIGAMSRAMYLATCGFARPGFRIIAPFVYKTKDHIVSVGDRFEVPWQLTWSCYQGRDHHCGKCGTCVERREAFSLAGVVDPTIYETDIAHA